MARLRLVIVAAVCSGCPPAPPTSVELSDGRTRWFDERGTSIPCFDEDARPSVLVTPNRTGPWTMHLDARPLETTERLEAERLRVEAHADSVARGVHTLSVRRDDVEVGRWRVCWRPSPERLGPVVRSRAARARGEEQYGMTLLDHASTSTDGWTASWAALERLRWVQRSGDAARSQAAAITAAELADHHGLKIDAASRYRAAAYFAITRGAYAAAFGLLVRAGGIARGARDERGVGRSHYMSGLLAAELGDFRSAEAELSHALATAIEIGEANDQTQFAEYLAIVYTDLGRFDEAIDTIEAHPPAAGASLRIRAGNIANRAWVLAQALLSGHGRHGLAEARRLFEAAEQMYREAGDPQAAANQTAFLAQLELATGNLDEAEAHLSRLPPHDDLSLARWTARILTAELALARGDTAHAATVAADVLSGVERELGDKPSDETIAAEVILAESLAAQRSVDEAIEHQRRAWAQVRRLGRSTAVRRSMGTFLRKRRNVRSGLVELLVRDGRTREAFEVADAGRADVFRTLVSSAPSSADAKAWRRHHETRDELSRLVERGCRAEHLTECRQDLDRRIAAWSDAVALLYRPTEKDLGAPMALTSIQAALGPGQVVLLAEAQAADTVRTFWVDRTSIATATSATASRPWAARMSKADHIFFVPHTSHAIVETGSATTTWSLLPHAGWLAERDRQHPAGSEAVLVLGDASTRSERRWVAQALRGTALEDAATHDALARLAKAGVLHFAGHGRTFGADPWNTHLQLGPGQVIGAEDLLAIRPALRLAVLNGCETGPDARPNAIGLPQLLLLSGTQSVLATVQPVRDEAAFRFARRFYEAGGARSPGRAFAAASAASRAAGDGDAAAYRLWGLP